MIDGIGKSGPVRIDLNRTAAGAGAQAARVGQMPPHSQPVDAGGTVSDIVSAGAPVDSAKVAAIRAAILEGRYPVDPVKIAERMLDLDLPSRA
jgi:negative regulator of flagellin synthesis FlgM